MHAERAIDERREDADRDNGEESEAATLYLLHALPQPRQRPRCDSAAEQRDELAPFQLMEMHPLPPS